MRAFIDNGVLAGYVARAKKFYPLEYGEFLWGHKDGKDFVINVIDRAYEYDADEDGIEIDTPYEWGQVVNGQTLFGTIHSHPNYICKPSKTDIESAMDQEQVFGIVSLTKLGRRWLISHGFYLPTGKPVELVVSKPEKKKNVRTADIQLYKL